MDEIKNSNGIWKGVYVHKNGSISDSDARIVRRRLRILITADVHEMEILIAEVEKMRIRLTTLATMEFTVEDLTDPNKEF